MTLVDEDASGSRCLNEFADHPTAVHGAVAGSESGVMERGEVPPATANVKRDRVDGVASWFEPPWWKPFPQSVLSPACICKGHVVRSIGKRPP